MGSHIILQLGSGTIEVHLATTEFTKMAELNLRKGDQIEVTGWKTEFEGVQTIFAREVRHGQDVLVSATKAVSRCGRGPYIRPAAMTVPQERR
jgi:hypothetical protein